MKVIQKFNNGTQTTLNLSNTEFHRRKMILNLIYNPPLKARLLDKLNELSSEHRDLVNELLTVTEISPDNDQSNFSSSSLHL